MISNAVKILIVEDDPIIAEDIQSLLMEENYRIARVVHKGSNAIDALANCDIDFAILDVHLEGTLSGIDVAKVIDEKYHLPYIFLTSFDDEDTLEAAQNHSPYGYLVKPFQDRSLLTTIKIALSTHQKSNKASYTELSQIEEILNQKFTSQEFKVIKGFLSGRSYQQLADDLHVSINTIKYHAKNIYLKCDLKGRGELLSKLII